MSSNNTGETLIALLTGAIIGAGVGILFAPDKGTKTRKRIGKEAKRTQRNVKEKFDQTSDVLSAKAQVARESFSEKLNETLVSASHKADDILLAMEEKLEELRKQNAKLKNREAKKA